MIFHCYVSLPEGIFTEAFIFVVRFASFQATWVLRRKFGVSEVRDPDQAQSLFDEMLSKHGTDHNDLRHLRTRGGWGPVDLFFWETLCISLCHIFWEPRRWNPPNNVRVVSPTVHLPWFRWYIPHVFSIWIFFWMVTVPVTICTTNRTS